MKTTHGTPRWITVREIAEHLRVAPGTIRNWVSDGVIPHHHIRGVVRFDLEEVERWARQRGSEAR